VVVLAVVGLLVLVLHGNVKSHERATPAPGEATGTLPVAPPPGALPPGSDVTSTVRFEGRLVAAGLYFPGRAHPALPGCADGCEPVIWTSTSGTRWTTAWDTGAVTLGSDTTQHLVVMPGGLLLFDSGTGGSALWQSTDDVSWRRVDLPDAMTALSAEAAVWGHGHVVALFRNKFAGGPDTAYGSGDTVWTSTDGISWQQAQISGQSFLTSVSTTTSGFRIDGESSSTHDPTVWTSSDGETWTEGALGTGLASR